MSKNSRDALPATFSPQWQDWLASNIVAGCIDADLEKVMTGNGFSAGFARAAILVVRAMTERVQQQAPETLVAHQADPFRLAKGSVLRAHDRDVKVVFTLSNPNVAVIEGLLSEQECDELVAASAGKLERSLVVDRDSGGHQVSHVRSSEGTHFQRGEIPLVGQLEKRIAALTGFRVEQGEPLQILHYGVGGEYLPHHDYFDPKDPGTPAVTRQGGQRVATLVLYLNSPQEGGGTAFPDLELDVRARKGSAVYFEYMNRLGQLDARCLHAGTPVVSGEKWIATKWIRQSNY